MVFNISSIKTSSNGVWQGDNPLDYAFPLLILQIFLILLLSRCLAYLFKPLRQPKVIAEIVGGILLGPSAFGRNQNFMHRIFPSWSTPVLESVASIGLLFFLFLVGLELDLNSIRRSGRRAFAIAATGISVPFILGSGVAILLRKTIDGADKVGFGSFIVFNGVALSITAFPVLARVLAELNLLTTQVGELAMAAAALNDVVAWILLALAIAIAGDGDGEHRKSPLVSVWVLLSGVGFVILMMFAIRPAMKWVARMYSSEQEASICLTLAGVMVSGFMTDLIGIHSIFGAFVFGLTIPKGDFAEGLIERIEDFVSGLFLPLYFASSGLKTNVAKIQGGKAWGLLVLVTTAACAGKILGTLAAAMICLIPARESLTLGFLMNTKGLVELIVLNIGKEKKVLNDEMFAILVLMALFTTFLTAPSVMAIYEPARGISARTRRRLDDLPSSSKKKAAGELRVLACDHGSGNPSIIRLIELVRSTDILSLSTVDEDICHVAERKRVSLIILPFHKQWRTEMEEQQIGNWRHEIMENVGDGWGVVNQRVLKNSPCSVALLVDRGFGNGSTGTNPDVVDNHRVCILFFGGPDDREAMKLGGRMAEHAAVEVTVVRFVDRRNGLASDGVLLRPSLDKCSEKRYSFSTTTMNREKEQGLDETAVEEFRRKWDKAVYKEKAARNIVEEVLRIGQSREHDLIVVGKGRFPTSMVAEMADRQAEYAELGPIGDILASSGQGVVSSVLVIQQHDVDLAEEAPMSNVVDEYYKSSSTMNGNPATNDNNV